MMPLAADYCSATQDESRAAGAFPPIGIDRRLGWLRTFRVAIASNQDRLIELARQDTLKSEFETLVSDVAPLLASCRWHERHAKGLLKTRNAPGTPIWLRHQSHKIARAPLGRVGIIATWNYPLLLLGAQLVQTLVAGNRVVVKPSERSPRSQAMLLDLAEKTWREFGLPDGCIERFPATREGGEQMLEAGGLDHVVFTGSTAVGKHIAAWGAETLTPTTLELSGRDSALVLDDADPAVAARSIWAALTFNAGQTCMAPRRVLVGRGVYADFVRSLGLVASGAEPRSLIDESAATHCADLVDDAVARGGRRLTGVHERSDGKRLRPQAVVDCPEDAELVAGDHFGPVIAVVPVESESHMLRVHLACEQHLSVSLYTKDRAKAQRLVPELGASVVTINDTLVPSAHPATSVAGRGLSGWGASQGRDGLLALTRPVHVSRSGVFRTPTRPDPRVGWKRMSAFVAGLYGASKRSSAGASGDTPPRPADAANATGGR